MHAAKNRDDSDSISYGSGITATVGAASRQLAGSGVDAREMWKSKFALPVLL